MVECAICFEPRALVRIDPCAHDLYCRECLKQLSDCPMCRTRVIRLLPKNGDDDDDDLKEEQQRKPQRPNRAPPPNNNNNNNNNNRRSGRSALPKKRTILQMIRAGDIVPGEGFLTVKDVDGFRGEILGNGQFLIPEWNGRARKVDTPAAFATEVFKRAGHSKKSTGWKAIVYHPPAFPRRVPKLLEEVRDQGYPRPRAAPSSI
ncbi:hypothetical protein CTAYLR_009049 [Chrysophaeum taylorii]|uniref:RING-type domain-containing protein n=1 Tax=Chrysophaeum taylorii TaxID=2483200 RepID=A0AAD7UE02_9STRA|nr:hypothetical protein CTAYLR_009049 [Chrysophaeum taylorii]